MEHKDYEILGNILNSTWGVGSTNNPRGATQSIKGNMMDAENLLLSYSCIVNFGEPHERRKEMERISGDSGGFLNACIKKIKEDFKDATGRTLKVKNVSDSDDYQMLSLGQYSGRRDALYQRKLVLGVT